MDLEDVPVHLVCLAFECSGVVVHVCIAASVIFVCGVVVPGVVVSCVGPVAISVCSLLICAGCCASCCPVVCVTTHSGVYIVDCTHLVLLVYLC